MISIIVAVAANRVIGKDNTLIWHLPADMKFFKEKTSGHCIITGRKNYESIPEKFRPLPKRTNIVITRQANYSAPGAIIANSLEQALNIAKEKGDPEIFIIGGGEIYRQSLRYADRIYLTQIEQEFDGDTYFPDLPSDKWKITENKAGSIDEKNIYPHRFVVLDKID